MSIYGTHARGLEKVAWESERTYRVLSYFFALRWNCPMGEDAHRVLSRFEAQPDPRDIRMPATPGIPPVYSLLERGPRSPMRYRLLYGNEVMAARESPADVIDYLLWHVQDEAIRRTGDFLLVHSGAVRAPSGAGVLLPASMESGKTTLTAALVRAGFDYLSDEAALIDPVTHMLYPFAKPLTLKSGSFAYFPELAERFSSNGHSPTRWHVQPDDLRTGSISGPCPVRFVISPRYRPGSPTEMTGVSRAAGVMDLATNAMNLRLYGSRGIRLLAEVARQARCYRISVGSLDEAVTLISRMVGRSAGRHRSRT